MSAPDSTPIVQPRAAVIAVTFRADEVIVVRRRNEPQQGAWGFPGGSINLGESIRDAVLRELHEETGATAEVLELIDVVEVRERDSAGRYHHYILIAMLCRFVSGELRAGDDALECTWAQVPEGLNRFGGRLVDHAREIASRGMHRWIERQGGSQQ